jgi:HSP20 family protein
MPAVDVRETNDEVHVTAELPGMKSEDVTVTMENGVLTISGEKKQELQEGKDDGDYYLFERRYGRFERSFTLPRTVNAYQITARFEDGILTITLPKAENAKPRRVQIEANGRSR